MGERHVCCDSLAHSLLPRNSGPIWGEWELKKLETGLRTWPLGDWFLLWE